MRQSRQFQACFYKQISNAQNSTKRKPTIYTSLKVFARAKNRYHCRFLFAYFCFVSWFLLVCVFVRLKFVKTGLKLSWLSQLPILLSQKLFLFPQKLASVKSSFRRNFVIYRKACHAVGNFVFWYHHVTYRRPCHASDHLVTASATALRERFLLPGVFYLTLLPAGFKASLGAGCLTSKLTGLHADLWNIAPAWLFVWIPTIHKKVILIGVI